MKDKDNQQERSYYDHKWLTEIKKKQDWIWYIVGFIDGEGSLNVSFRRTKTSCGWRIHPVLNVTQKEREILSQIKQFFGCGTLRARADGVWYFEIDNMKMIRQKVIPFFAKYPFRTTKKKVDFRCFSAICDLLDDPNWSEEQTFIKILNLRDQMNVRTSKRKYSNEFILNNRKSSETTRQTRDQPEMI